MSQSSRTPRSRPRARTKARSAHGPVEKREKRTRRPPAAARSAVALHEAPAVAAPPVHESPPVLRWIARAPVLTAAAASAAVLAAASAIGVGEVALALGAGYGAIALVRRVRRWRGDLRRSAPVDRVAGRARHAGPARARAHAAVAPV